MTVNGKHISNYKFNFVEVLGVDLPRLVPSVIWNALDRYRSDPVAMKRYLSRHKTTLHTEYSKTDSFYVSGEFAQDEERIHLYVVRPAKFSESGWRSFKFEIVVTLMHEYIHFMQYMFHEHEFDLILLHKEDPDDLRQEEREYYACWAEIQAYAHCIYMEMKNRCSTKTCGEMLQHPKQFYSPTLRNIRRKFEGFDYPLRYLYREVLRWERRYERHALTLNS